MTDLIERLKAVDHTSLEDCFAQSPLFAQAADEITRQREVIEAWKRECDKLQAERDRAETTGFVAPLDDKRPAKSTGEWAEYWQGLKR